MIASPPGVLWGVGVSEGSRL
jgi:hypothetical protein